MFRRLGIRGRGEFTVRFRGAGKPLGVFMGCMSFNKACVGLYTVEIHDV